MCVTLFPPMKTNLIHRWLISVDTRMQEPVAVLFWFYTSQACTVSKFWFVLFTKFCFRVEGPDYEEVGRNIQLRHAIVWPGFFQSNWQPRGNSIISQINILK
jgi:hypothetical protein